MATKTSQLALQAKAFADNSNPASIDREWWSYVSNALFERDLLEAGFYLGKLNCGYTAEDSQKMLFWMRKNKAIINEEIRGA